MGGQEVKSSEIIQRLAVKLQIVSASAEATAMTLRIDDVVELNYYAFPLKKEVLDVIYAQGTQDVTIQ